LHDAIWVIQNPMDHGPNAVFDHCLLAILGCIHMIGYCLAGSVVVLQVKRVLFTYNMVLAL